MLEIKSKLAVTIDAIRKVWNKKPEVGIILGTGMGGFVDYIDIDTVINYSDLPNFAESTVESHHGSLFSDRFSGHLL